MLSNAYFLAKFRFDTAENEPAKNLQNFANFADPNPLTPSFEPLAQGAPVGNSVPSGVGPPVALVGRGGRPRVPRGSRLRTRLNNIEYFPPNFEGLVLGCIDAKFSK